MDYFISKHRCECTLLTLFCFASPFFMGCTAQENPSGSEVHSFLLTELYQNFVEDGVSIGFNLDHRISDETDPQGCYQSDFVDPQGKQGIDNGYGSLLPFFEASEVDVYGNLLEDGFTNEVMPILLRVSDVQDHKNDEYCQYTLIMFYEQYCK